MKCANGIVAELCCQNSIEKLQNLILLGLGVVFNDLSVLHQFNGRISLNLELICHIGFGFAIHGLKYDSVSIDLASVEILLDFVKNGLCGLTMRAPLYLE